MKRTIKSIAAVMVVLTLCLAMLTACGASGVVGTWKMTGASAMGMEVDASEMGMEDSVMTLNADGTITVDGETGGEWKLDGDKFSMIDEGITITGTYDGTKITLEVMGISMIFTRA